MCLCTLQEEADRQRAWADTQCSQWLLPLAQALGISKGELQEQAYRALALVRPWHHDGVSQHAAYVHQGDP